MVLLKVRKKESLKLLIMIYTIKYINYLLKETNHSKSVSEYDTVNSRGKNVLHPLNLSTSELEYMKLFLNRSLSIMNRYTNDLVIKNNRLLKNHIPITTKRKQIKLFNKIKYPYEIEQSSNDDKESSFVAIQDNLSKLKNKMPKKVSRTTMISNISTNINCINRHKSFSQSMNESKDNNKEISLIYS